MKPIKLFSFALLIGIFTLASAFIGIGNPNDTPGTIEVIG